MIRRLKIGLGPIVAAVLLVSGCDLPKLGDKSEQTTDATVQQVAVPQEGPANPLDALATQTCGDSAVAACKTKGKEVFEAIPAASRGDENKANTAAASHKELAALPDQPEKLEQAIRLVTSIDAYATAIKEGSAIDTAANAAGLFAAFPEGVTQQDVNIGSHGDHAVDWALNTKEERGPGSFTTRTLKTPAEVSAFLNDPNDPKAKANRDSVDQGIRKHDYGDNEVARAMSGAGYIPLQLREASQVLGTSFYRDGQVLIAGAWRQAAPGDVYWLYFANDGKFIPEATVRADCGNSNVTAIRVMRPGMPEAPSVEQPPGEEVCPQGNVLHPGAGVCSPPPPPGCKERGDCPPPPCTHCVNQKKPPEGYNNGQPGDGDGGGTKYGPDGTERHGAPTTAQQTTQARPATQTNPAPPPAPQPPPAPKVTPTVTGSPTTTATPTQEPPNHGEVPTTGPGCGQFC